MNLINKQRTGFPSIMDDFFNTSWNIPITDYTDSTPAVNVKEDDKFFILHIAAPGINKDDFKICIENKVISIEVVKNDENENDDFTRKEFNFNSFKRSFSIPKNVQLSKINASYLNGVLEIQLPKNKEDQVQPKKFIKIK